MPLSRNLDANRQIGNDGNSVKKLGSHDTCHVLVCCVQICVSRPNLGVTSEFGCHVRFFVSHPLRVTSKFASSHPNLRVTSDFACQVRFCVSGPISDTFEIPLPACVLTCAYICCLGRKYDHLNHFMGGAGGCRGMQGVQGIFGIESYIHHVGSQPPCGR
jgi:hypothetical protein